MRIVTLIGYIARYVAIYLLFISIFAKGAYEKITEDVPGFFLEGWAGTWAASFPGLEASWRLAGLLEAAAAIILIVSIVMLEWLPGKPKTMAKLGISTALVFFMMLAWGQQLIGATDGIANLWLYFGTALAAMIVIRNDEKDDASEGSSDRAVTATA